LPGLAELRLENARDVIHVLHGQVAALLEDQTISTVERARTVALLCSGLLRAFEQSDLLDRLETLERKAGEDRRHGGIYQ